MESGAEGLVDDGLKGAGLLFGEEGEAEIQVWEHQRLPQADAGEGVERPGAHAQRLGLVVSPPILVWQLPFSDVGAPGFCPKGVVGRRL